MKNKILFNKSYIEIQCDRSDAETQRLMADLYPAYHNRILTLYRVSPHLVPEVLALLCGLGPDNMQNAPVDIQELYYNEIATREHTSDLLKNGPRDSCVVSSKLTLKPHQQLGRELARYQDKFAFFYDTRTGKTPMSLTIINDDLQEHPNHKWIVICPLILINEAWMEDAAKFFPDMKIVNCHAATKDKRLAAIHSPGNVYVTNTESFIAYRQYFDELGLTGGFVDESSDLKSHKSKVSNEVVDFAFHLDRFYLLSGTPAPNGEWEYYMQMRAVEFYGWQSSYSQFKERYFVDTSFNSQYEKLALRPDMHDELFSKIKSRAIYIDKDDVLDTPGRDFIPVDLEMPDELMKHYRKLKNDLYVELKDDLKISVKSAAAKLNKLNQVSSGFIMDTHAAKENKYYGTDLAEWYLLDDYRFKALKDLVNQDDTRGEQILIFANYRREFELIQQTLGAESCGCVYGGVNLTEKEEAIRKFKHGEIKYLIANPASADKGLTLTNCHICVYFSLNWSYELYRQSCERIYGSKTIQPLRCKYYIMLAKNTIDGILYNDVLQGKRDASFSVLNHLKPEVIVND